MASRDARNFIVVSRSGPTSDAAQATIRDLRAAGCQIEYPCCDITDKNALEESLRISLQQLPPLRGVIQAAMVLEVKTTFSILSFFLDFRCNHAYHW